MRPSGYTLIELLVVISMISLFSVIAFVSFKDFSQDQVLNKAIDKLGNTLRTAQTNGSAGVLCGNSPSLSWRIEFTTLKPNEIKLSCELADGTILNKDTKILEGVNIVETKADSCPVEPLTIRFKSSQVDFLGADCLDASFKVNIKLKDMKTGVEKTINISKGGALNVQN